MFYFTEENEREVISKLCDFALRSGGLEGLPFVNYVNSNLQRLGVASDENSEEANSEEYEEEEKEIIRPIEKKQSQEEVGKKKKVLKKKPESAKTIKKKGRPRGSKNKS